jgi:hypothetical protein
MAACTSSGLPPNFEHAKDLATGRTYFIDHTNETTSWIHPRIRDELPPNFDARIDTASGQIYFVDHTNKTTSRSHPRHKEFHRTSDPDLPYPYEQCLDAEGRHFYTNDENKTRSWMHPVKLAELQANGILDDDTDEYGGEDGQAWKAWILEDIAECGLSRGETYFVNYRTGDVNWASPEHMRIAHQKALERRAAREAAEDQDNLALRT